MYNGIGLTTPRGSGTNGYVQRNLAVLRNHQTAAERAADYEKLAPPKHREPDEAILEHERLRKVEVKCLELQVKLEDDEIDEADIELQVEALRKKLMNELQTKASIDAKSLKPSDTHGLAAAKKTELRKMASALRTRTDYEEGDAFNKEKQEQLREQRNEARVAAVQKRAEQEKKMEEQRLRWESEKRERDRLRRRAEDKARQEREARGSRRMSPPPPPGDRYARPREDRRSGSPPSIRDRRRSRSRSPYGRRRSPPPRGRYDSPPRRPRSPSPRRDSRPYRSRSRSLTPPEEAGQMVTFSVISQF